MATMKERQREVQLYRGQIPSPGRPGVAWREDRVRFWAVIALGDKTDDAAVAVGVSSPVGYRWFRQAGGVNPCLAPTVSGRYLTFSEREDIALYRAQGLGVREIARRVDRSPSTISRELRRNASTRTFRLAYKATIAQWHAEPRARRPKVAKLAESERLRTWVQDRLAGEVKLPDGTTVGPKPKAWNGKNAQSCVRLRRCAPAARRCAPAARRPGDWSCSTNSRSAPVSASTVDVARYAG